jgi:hypothetical protein
MLKQANRFDIQGGEAEAVVLYWQETAGWLPTTIMSGRREI